MQRILNSAHFLAWEEPGYAHVRFAHVCTAREVPCQKMRRIQKCWHGDTTPNNPPTPIHHDNPVGVLPPFPYDCSAEVAEHSLGNEGKTHSLGLECRFIDGRRLEIALDSHEKLSKK